MIRLEAGDFLEVVALDEPAAPLVIGAVGGHRDHALATLRIVYGPSTLLRGPARGLGRGPGFTNEAVGNDSILPDLVAHLLRHHFLFGVIPPGRGDDMGLAIGTDQDPAGHERLAQPENDLTGML